MSSISGRPASPFMLLLSEFFFFWREVQKMRTPFARAGISKECCVHFHTLAAAAPATTVILITTAALDCKSPSSGGGGGAADERVLGNRGGVFRGGVVLDRTTITEDSHFITSQLVQ